MASSPTLNLFAPKFKNVKKRNRQLLCCMFFCFVLVLFCCFGFLLWRLPSETLWGSAFDGLHTYAHVRLSLSLSLKFLFSVLSGVVSQRYSICLSCEILDIWTLNRGAKDTGRKEEAKRRRQISFGKLLENIINSNIKTNKKSNSPVSPHKNLKIVVSFFFFFFFSFDR